MTEIWSESDPTSDAIPFLNDTSEQLKIRLREIKENCTQLHLFYPINIIERIVETPLESLTRGNVRNMLSELKRSVEFELESVLFMHIPKTKVKYFDNDCLFGDEVFENFPSARDEIKEAGKSYAVGLNTACVFHLMRVVEIGAKKMISAMKAEKYLTTSISVNGAKKMVKKPIELCDWQMLINGLNKALSELEKGKSVNTKRKQTHSYFSHAILQFSYFKDAWRNNVSHSNDVAPGRKLYLAGETKDIVENTRQFMQHLAKNIKE